MSNIKSKNIWDTIADINVSKKKQETESDLESGRSQKTFYRSHQTIPAQPDIGNKEFVRGLGSQRKSELKNKDDVILNKKITHEAMEYFPDPSLRKKKKLKKVHDKSYSTRPIDTVDLTAPLDLTTKQQRLLVHRGSKLPIPRDTDSPLDLSVKSTAVTFGPSEGNNMFVTDEVSRSKPPAFRKLHPGKTGHYQITGNIIKKISSPPHQPKQPLSGAGTEGKRLHHLPRVMSVNKSTILPTCIPAGSIPVSGGYLVPVKSQATFVPISRGAIIVRGEQPLVDSLHMVKSPISPLGENTLETKNLSQLRPETLEALGKLSKRTTKNIQQSAISSTGGATLQNSRSWAGAVNGKQNATSSLQPEKSTTNTDSSTKKLQEDVRKFKESLKVPSRLINIPKMKETRDSKMIEDNVMKKPKHKKKFRKLKVKSKVPPTPQMDTVVFSREFVKYCTGTNSLSHLKHTREVSKSDSLQPATQLKDSGETKNFFDSFEKEIKPHIEKSGITLSSSHAVNTKSEQDISTGQSMNLFYRMENRRNTPQDTPTLRRAETTMDCTSKSPTSTIIGKITAAKFASKMKHSLIKKFARVMQKEWMMRNLKFSDAKKAKTCTSDQESSCSLHTDQSEQDIFEEENKSSLDNLDVLFEMKSEIDETEDAPIQDVEEARAIVKSIKNKMKKRILNEIANSDGYVAETKRQTVDNLFANPSQLDREERWLQKALMQFEEIEQKETHSMQEYPKTASNIKETQLSWKDDDPTPDLTDKPKPRKRGRKRKVKATTPDFSFLEEKNNQVDEESDKTGNDSLIRGRGMRKSAARARKSFELLGYVEDDCYDYEATEDMQDEYNSDSAQDTFQDMQAMDVDPADETEQEESVFKSDVDSQQYDQLVGAGCDETSYSITCYSVKNDPDAPLSLKRISFNRKLGETLLHKAARVGHEESVIYCLEKNLYEDVNARDHAGYTALHEASVKGNVTMVHYLLSYGADVNCCSHDGIRPIHDAVENDHIEVVRLLLSWGADATLATYTGWVPTRIAHSDKMKQFLKGYFSDLNGNEMYYPWEMPGSSIFELENISGYDIAEGIPSDDEDCDGDIMFDFGDESHLATYFVRPDIHGRYKNYAVLYDVLEKLRIQKDDLLTLHSNILIETMAIHEFAKQLACSQIKQTCDWLPEQPELSEDCIDLVLYDDNLQELTQMSPEYLSQYQKKVRKADKIMLTEKHTAVSSTGNTICDKEYSMDESPVLNGNVFDNGNSDNEYNDQLSSDTHEGDMGSKHTSNACNNLAVEKVQGREVTDITSVMQDNLLIDNTDKEKGFKNENDLLMSNKNNNNDYNCLLRMHDGISSEDNSALGTLRKNYSYADNDSADEEELDIQITDICSLTENVSHECPQLDIIETQDISEYPNDNTEEMPKLTPCIYD